MSAIVKTPLVTGQVTEYLKKQITGGRWAPGTKIDSENQLTRELGVSRASVRSGIQQLTAIGILESHQGKGTFVRAIPAQSITQRLDRLYKENKDMRDLLEYRMIIEVECCRLAAKRLTGRELEQMQEQNQRMESELDRNGKRSSEAFAESDFGFHKLIYLATGNQLIIDSMKRITAETERYQRKFNTDFLAERAVHYHGKILQALQQGDGDRAAEEMRKHLSVVLLEYDKLLEREQ